MKNFFYESANKSGVYKIINTINNRVYYGSCKRFKQRAYEHKTRLMTNCHSNRFLQNDFNKCGEQAFEFHVVKVVEDKDRKIIEQQFIDEVYDNQKHCYNIVPKTIVTERDCFSRTPEETKKLLSEKSKAMWSDPKHRAKIKKIHDDSEWRKNQSEKQKKVSQNSSHRNSAEAHRKRLSNSEEREKLSKSLKKAWARDDGSRREQASILAKIVYKANKEKIAEARIKAKAKYYGKVVSPEGKIFEIYNAQVFIREHGFSQMFYDLLNGKYKSYKGWKKLG